MVLSPKTFTNSLVYEVRICRYVDLLELSAVLSALSETHTVFLFHLYSSTAAFLHDNRITGTISPSLGLLSLLCEYTNKHTNKKMMTALWISNERVVPICCQPLHPLTHCDTTESSFVFFVFFVSVYWVLIVRPGSLSLPRPIGNGSSTRTRHHRPDSRRDWKPNGSYSALDRSSRIDGNHSDRDCSAFAQ